VKRGAVSIPELAVSHPDRGGSFGAKDTRVFAALREHTSGRINAPARACPFCLSAEYAANPVAPGLLRQIEASSAQAQQLFGFLGVIGECGNPRETVTGPSGAIVIPKLELWQLPYEVAPAFWRAASNGHSGKEHEEFLASVPAGDVGLPRKPLSTAASSRSTRSPAFVAEAVRLKRLK